MQRRGSVFEKHDFGGFDYGGNFVADFEFHFFGAATGDDAFDEVLPDADDDVSHDAAELEFFDGAFQRISSGECHGSKDTVENGKLKMEKLRGRAGAGLKPGPYAGREARLTTRPMHRAERTCFGLGYVHVYGLVWYQFCWGHDIACPYLS